MVSKVRSNDAGTVIRAGLDMKCFFEDEWLDSLNESMCTSIGDGQGISASGVTPGTDIAVGQVFGGC